MKVMPLHTIESLLKDQLDRIHTIEDFAAHLERFLSSGCDVSIEPNRERVLLFGRALVEKINGIKIEIYPREHGQPHFHVLADRVDAKFNIMDGAFIEGSITSSARNLIVFWYQTGRPKLIETWNKTRPTDCPVGPIHEKSN